MTTITTEHATLAIGWLSAEFAARADAWNGNAPEWFPEPPEWIELWDRALAETAGESPSSHPAIEEEGR